MIPFNSLTVGRPRIGKNTFHEDEVLWWADRGYTAVILLPHEHDWGPRILSLLIARGHGEKVYVHRLSEDRRAMRVNLLPYSTHPSWLKRAEENEDTRNEIRWQFGQKRQIDYERQALIDETIGLLLELLMAQPRPYKLTDLLEASYPRSRLHQDLRKNCLDLSILMRLDSMLGGIVNERQTWGAAQRLVRQFLGSMAICVRDDTESCFDETLERGAIHIFEGANNPRVTSTLFGMVKVEVVTFLRNRYGRTGEPFPLLLLVDEAQGF